MTSPDYITHEEIRARAYQLWQENGRPAGRDAEFWFQAENEHRARRDALHDRNVQGAQARAG